MQFALVSKFLLSKFYEAKDKKYFATTFLQVTGYASKKIGLYCKPSIIFRSDSNGEDLEGYAGAGLYDRFVQKV